MSGICSWSEALVSSLTIQFARGCKCWHPLAPGRRYGARSPLSEYMSLHLSLKLTTNCVPLSRIKWEVYFYKEVCFISLIEFRKSCLIISLMNPWISIQQLLLKREPLGRLRLQSANNFLFIYILLLFSYLFQLLKDMKKQFASLIYDLGFIKEANPLNREANINSGRCVFYFSFHVSNWKKDKSEFSTTKLKMS